MFDVIIIGAGLSGLTTAYKILQKEPSLRLKILEANDTIGGQIASSKLDGELGAKLLKADQAHIYNLFTDLGIHMLRRRPISRNLKRSWAIDSGPFAFIAKFELQRYMNDLDLQSQLFRPGTYDLSSEDKKYTMWRHIRKSLFFENSRLFMINFVRLIAGVDSKDISFVEFMNILHSCGDLTTLMELYIEPSQSVLEFSSEQLLAAFETRLEPVSIKRLTKVIEIQHHEDYVQIGETNGTIHTARVAVLAIPCNQIEDIFITPPIPMEWEIPYLGDKYFITSFRVNYDEPHWRRRGFSVGCILHGQGFELLIKSIVLKSLAESFGNEMTEPVSYIQQTYEQTSLLNLPYTTPWNRIIWSSTSTATLYRGCLNGAVQSGLRSAIHALLILRPQSINWQDLAEIQKASVVYRYPSHWDLLKSSMNVYNTMVYSTIAIVVFCVLKNRNKIFN
ncbi:probable flavin-containing monoamine oxidase A isoform X2 [Episyrphus balteatus]|uniref:probable flavin-containing monoamine oxidase A isoform X2 n=1 Tax=Episyrphus balteatus TaxID=286459 RepID=UPI0024864E08|nr:probable flavin-containing monoamine oxidase A isoform X2 [Episyrphus balteatus]